MGDTPANGSNAHRIRQLEREVRDLKQLLFQTTRGAMRNPVARKIKLPAAGVPGRVDEVPGSATCDNVWLNSNDRLYIPPQQTVIKNILTERVMPDGERLALAYQHDDGYWWLGGFDCNDNGSGDTIGPIDPGTDDPDDPGTDDPDDPVTDDPDDPVTPPGPDTN